MFEDMLKNQVIPAICAQVPWASKVVVQMDNAGGHKTKTNIPTLNKYTRETENTVVEYNGERKKIPTSL
jgi:hypothetical protein